MPQTITSVDLPHTHLETSVPSRYLSHVIVASLKRRGFQAAEAGALIEMERLLKRHVQNLFIHAKRWSDLANRSSPNALDFIASHEDRVKRLKRESKRPRKGPKLSTIPREPSPTPLQLLTDLKEIMLANNGSSDDIKPTMMDIPERKLEGAFEGAPSLPGEWTYADPRTDADGDPDNSVEPPSSRLPLVTPSSLEFVKSTVAEKGIDPELGIVNYRKRARGALR
ncbi:hypothetical protein BD324DRAFT_639597 [Kockovaella imperatae]|uniref:Bromodomain associated domain-containing protein n=1 Tax=Kockovaella imperatae TaxID=4999 RepID=A0A1Y1U7K8_9TREE|nr:hypothetical protein BD324DRAFT_639597 [Kockovaella imperatae]ORX33506.1 hypothetical protein BD324DRAFT_639597 [Kockovaella imperatae]